MIIIITWRLSFYRPKPRFDSLFRSKKGFGVNYRVDSRPDPAVEYADRFERVIGNPNRALLCLGNLFLEEKRKQHSNA